MDLAENAQRFNQKLESIRENWRDAARDRELVEHASPVDHQLAAAAIQAMAIQSAVESAS